MLIYLILTFTCGFACTAKWKMYIYVIQLHGCLDKLTMRHKKTFELEPIFNKQNFHSFIMLVITLSIEVYT